MTDGNASDFINKLSYEDHYILFNNKKFFLNGCQTKKDRNENVLEVRLEIYDLSTESTVFSVSKKSIQECLTAFEDAKIWDGKSFWEAEKDMKWIDC